SAASSPSRAPPARRRNRPRASNVRTPPETGAFFVARLLPETPVRGAGAVAPATHVLEVVPAQGRGVAVEVGGDGTPGVAERDEAGVLAGIGRVRVVGLLPVARGEAWGLDTEEALGAPEAGNAGLFLAAGGDEDQQAIGA